MFYLYSLKFVIDLSYDSPEIINDILSLSNRFTPLYEGSAEDGAFVYDDIANGELASLEKKWNSVNPSILRFTHYFKKLQYGDLFFMLTDNNEDIMHNAALHAMSNYLQNKLAIKESIKSYKVLFAQLYSKYKIYSVILELNCQASLLGTGGNFIQVCSRELAEHCNCLCPRPAGKRLIVFLSLN